MATDFREPLDEEPELDSMELFSAEAVERFRKTPDLVKLDEQKHYNQLRTTFNERELRLALKKFRIPFHLTATVYGGFTGEFAGSLARIGMKVIFTDPLDAWVEAARRRGLEAYYAPVQKLPREIMERTELFASFECFPDLIEGEEQQHAKMRLLTAPYGIFFVESKATVESMRQDQNPASNQELGQFRRWFRAIYKVYGIKRIATTGTSLNFYHVFAVPESRVKIEDDLRVMNAIHRSFPVDQVVGNGQIQTIAMQSGLTESEAKSSLERLSALSDSIHLPYKKIFPFLQSKFKGDLRIGRKRVYIRP